MCVRSLTVAALIGWMPHGYTLGGSTIFPTLIDDGRKDTFLKQYRNRLCRAGQAVCCMFLSAISASGPGELCLPGWSLVS